MNEALLAGALDVVSAGVPPMLTVWDRTKGKQNVKAIASLGSMPNYLLTNNPNVKTIKDFTDKDRIAVPAAGVGFQSRTLQIETAKVFGNDNYKKFDNISVSLAHRMPPQRCWRAVRNQLALLQPAVPVPGAGKPQRPQSAQFL